MARAGAPSREESSAVDVVEVGEIRGDGDRGPRLLGRGYWRERIPVSNVGRRQLGYQELLRHPLLYPFFASDPDGIRVEVFCWPR